MTPEEWVEVRGRGREWNGSWSSPRRSVFKLQALLRSYGIALKVETPAGGGLRIHVDTPEISALIEPDILTARRIDERVTARHEGRRPEVLEDTPTVAELAENYRAKTHPLRWLSRRHGMSRRLIRKTLEAAKVKIRSPGRVPVERVRPPELVGRALRAFDEGASVRAIARILKCSRWSAKRFLVRHGRELVRGPEGEVGENGITVAGTSPP